MKNDKKASQLGMPIGTASARLRKSIIFDLLKQLNRNYCHQCGAEIETVDELSVEHKIPYLDSENPVKLFFDLDNIAFSHLSCNCSASRRVTIEHGATAYRKGRCRCNICTEDHAQRQRDFRSKTQAELA